MKNAFINAAVLIGLIGSMSALASPTTVFDGSTVTDTFEFLLTQESSVSIGYSWSDMALHKEAGKNQENHFYDAGSLAWSLTGSDNQTVESGSFEDGKSVSAVSFATLDLGKLAAGNYKLTLTGQWDAVTKEGDGNTSYAVTAGSVNWLDGDQSENNSFSAIPVLAAAAPTAPDAPPSSVPEPQTFAMLLTGLGLLGVTRRRKAAHR